jgi:hypothetical protein
MTQRKSESSASELAHELRTPITAILGYTNLLLEGEVSHEDAHEKLLVIRNHSEYLLKLVNCLLSDRAGGLPPRRARLDPLALAEEVASLVEPLARRKGLALSVAAAGPVPIEITTDEMRLRQILINLLGNALKFTNEGSVRIVLALAPQGASALTLAVADTGIGMHAGQLARLFQPFVQLHSSARRQGGSGLGLSTSLRLARQLDGDLAIASNPGQGTTATVSVPLTPDQLAHARERHPAAAQAPLGALHGSELLLVGAGRECLLMASAILKRQQASITPAPDAAQAASAVERAVAGGRPFAAVLIDEDCGEILALARTLRALEYRGRILSLESDGPRHRPSRQEAGIDAIVTKPVQAKELIAAILADESVSVEHRT